MIRNFFIIAVRHFKRQFTFSFINVTGLAIGIASSLVILVYVLQELNYERHFPSYDRVYRISTKFMTMGDFASGPDILLEVLPKEYPWIEHSTRVTADGFKIKTENFTGTERGFLIDSGFFKVFPYALEEGKAIASKGEIVLSKGFAEKLFGEGSAIGKELHLTHSKGEGLFVVQGIIDTDKVNSHLNASFYACHGELATIDPNWMSAEKYNYIKVRQGVNQQEIQSAVDQVIASKLFPSLGSAITFEEWIDRDDAFRLIVQPLQDIYLKGTLLFDLTSGGNETMIYTLLVIAILILVIASINFINLSTARSAARAREVGIKKVIGSTRKQLAIQFLSESVFTSLLAFVLSLGFAELIVLVVQQVTGLGQLQSVFKDGINVLLAGFIALILGVISGIYPAVVLSSFKPSLVLKSGFSSPSRSGFRNTLVIFQFSLSTILVFGTLVIFRQLQFLDSKDLGFKQDNILVIENVGILNDHVKPFKEAMLSATGVKGVAIANRMPGSSSSYSVTNLKSEYIDEKMAINSFHGDYDYPELLGFQLEEGRFFDRNIASDSSAILLNEAAVRALQLVQPIGQKLEKDYHVIGVVKDFNFESLRKGISPAMISLAEQGYQMAIKIEHGQMQKVISIVEANWKAYSPDEPVQYQFLDNNFAKLMRKERVLGEVLVFFTLLAITVACLGLLGLSAYLATQRIKEIGIRKVMGASLLEILGLFSWQYSKLILTSFLLAIPCAYYVTDQWLAGFAYRVSLDWWLVGGICMAILLMAWTTVSYHSIKASRINPAETLRSE